MTIKGLDIAELNIVSNTELSSLYINGNSKLRYLILSDRKALENIFNFNCDADLNFIDENNNAIYGKIAGVLWQLYNVGASASNPFGEYFTLKEAKTCCPSGWRLPTKVELKTLITNYSVWTTHNGMSGRWFSGTNKFDANVLAIFLPAAGYSYSKDLDPVDVDWRGMYWASADGNSHFLSFSSSNVKVEYGSTDTKDDYSVRCVKD